MNYISRRVLRIHHQGIKGVNLGKQIKLFSLLEALHAYLLSRRRTKETHQTS